MTTHPNGRPTPLAVPTVPPPPPGGTTGVAGPLSQAVAEATARATRSRLDDDPHRAWDRTGGGRPALVPKRLLVAVSHAIEKAVVSSPIGGPGPSTVVIALFQRLEFFERERVVYERLAAAGAEVVVGFVRGEEHAPPRGVHTVLIEPDEKLADEWTVVAVGPRAGAFLVATDQHAYDAREHDVEASRQFSGRWGYAHAQAGAELARLRLALGGRLPEPLLRRIDGLLGETMAAGGEQAGSSGSPAEAWATASLAHMITRMQTAQAGSRRCASSSPTPTAVPTRTARPRSTRRAACRPRTSSGAGRRPAGRPSSRSASPCSTSPASARSSRTRAPSTTPPARSRPPCASRSARSTPPCA